MGQNAKSCAVLAAQEAGLRTLTRKFFTDRAYTNDGYLVPRGTPGAMIEDEDIAMERIVRLIRKNELVSITGKVIHMEIPQMIMLHGDQPKAVAFARKTRTILEQEGVALQNFARSL